MPAVMSMENDFISVVVPVYNVENYLGKCIDSLLAQTHIQFHLILVNDGSTDGSGAICDRYAQKDSRVTVLHRENGVLSAARNTGMEWSHGNTDDSWIAFVDSDDWVVPTYLEELHAAAVHHNCSIAIGSFAQLCDGDSLPITEGNGVLSLAPEDAWCSYRPVTAWGKLFRRPLFADVRFPEGKIHEDELTTYKVLFAVGRVVYIGKPLYAYMVRGGSIIGTQWSEKRLNTLDAIDAQVAYFKHNGFFKAYRYEMRHRATMTYNCLTNAKRCHDFSRQKCKTLQVRLRNTILDCRRENLSGFGRFSRCTLNAWLPMFDWPFWLVTKLIYRR